jgi:Contractile injection system tube protein
MALVPAFVEILEPDSNYRFPVQFNPTEYTLEKGAQIAEIAIPGLDSPILQFVRGQNRKLTLDLFFDTTEAGLDELAVDVRILTEEFSQLVRQRGKTHAPPRIRFSWGVGLSFKAIVENVREQFTLFNPGGVPLRATLSVTFREYKTLDEQIAELNLQSSNQTRKRPVVADDTLAKVAAEEYGDPSLWRVIADANREATRNVRRLRVGDILTIPAIEPAPATPAAEAAR